MQTAQTSSSIICVDDEKGILQAYNKILSGACSNEQKEELDSLLQRRRKRAKSTSVNDKKAVLPEANKYKIFTASNGEDAIEIVRKEMEAGRQIAAGFFDMAMPGGIDGTETIKRILQIDEQMLCAVVTAYTDRSPSQLSTLFKRQDDWFYFNKPFSTGELQQTAYHLVTSWNQRRREEMLVNHLQLMRNGLVGILHTVNNIDRVPPMMLDNILEGILEHFLKLVNADDGFIYLPDDKKSYCLGKGEFLVCDNQMKTITKKEQWDLSKYVMVEKKSVISGKMLATPLMLGKDAYGVLFLESKDILDYGTELFDMYAIQAVNMIQHSRMYDELIHYTDEISNKNQELIELFGKLTQTEHMRKQFEELSMVDGLTGILNRRCLDQKIIEEIKNARRYNVQVTCLMMDIDFFKKVNDTFGHAAGDYVLKELCSILKVCKRKYDILGRYGGEEFCLFIKDLDLTASQEFCERIRANVEKHKFVFKDQDISVTISIGCIHMLLDDNSNKDDIIHLADGALYQAKKNGRNQVCFS